MGNFVFVRAMFYLSVKNKTGYVRGELSPSEKSQEIRTVRPRSRKLQVRS